METKVITKQLAGSEDLLKGIGSVNQIRSTGTKTIRKLNVSEIKGALVVDTIAEMNLLLITDLGDTKSVLVNEDGNYYSYKDDEWVSITDKYTKEEVYNKEEINDKVYKIDTIDGLRLMTDTPDTVNVSGYYSASDNAFGSNFYALVPSGTDNDGTIIETVNGVYELQYIGDIDVAWFGVDVTGVENSTTAFRKAILVGNVRVKHNQIIKISGTSSIDKKLHIEDGGKIIDSGNMDSILYVLNGELISDKYSNAFDGVKIDDKINTDLVKIEGQDFCNRHGDIANDNNVYLSVTSDNTFTVGHVHMENSEMCTEYTFGADPDGFILLGEVSFGIADHDISSKQAYDATLDGTGFVGTGSGMYTTVVGDKISSTFYGRELYFRHYTDTRSGIWDVYIDGNYIKTITTHQTSLRSTSNSYTQHLWSGSTNSYVGENITTAGEHEVILIFKGADPLNASTSGSARGWLQEIGTFYVGGVPKMTSASRKEIVSSSSIEDFAFRIAPMESSASQPWVPRHSTDIVTINPIYSMSIDNETVFTNTSTLVAHVTNSYLEGKTIRFTSKCNVVHPDSPTVRAIVEREITITANGLSIDKVFEFTADTFVGVGYSNQIGINGANCTNIVCNNGLEFAPILADAPTTRLGYGCSSVLFKGEVDTGKFYELAYSVGSLRDAIGINKITNNSGLYKGVHFTHRADGVNKVYFSFADNDWFYIGDKIRTSSRLKPHILVSPSTNT